MGKAGKKKKRMKIYMWIEGHDGMGLGSDIPKLYDILNLADRRSK